MPGPAPRTLANRVILITGANGGLGETLAWACARAGAQVVLIGRRLPRLTRLYDALMAEGLPTPALYPMDLSGAMPADYEALADAVRAEFDGLDAVVHCAAEFKGLASLENAPLEDWFTGLHVNLTAPWLLSRALLPLLRERARSSLLFLLDDPALASKPFWGSYGVAKAGLEGLVGILHQELANSSVRVHGLRPGPMRTALRARAWFAEDASVIPPAAAYVPAIMHVLAADADDAPAFLPLHPTPPASSRHLGLAVRSE